MAALVQPPLPDGVSSCVFSCASCAFSCALHGRGHPPDSIPALPLRKESLSTVYDKSGAGRALKNPVPRRGSTLPAVHAVTITTAPPFSFPPVAKYPGGSEEQKGDSFLRTPNLLYPPALTGFRGFHSPRGAPAPPQLTHGVLQGKGAGNCRDTC